MSSFHERFDLSTKPWAVGVRGEPCATLIPFSFQNAFIFLFANSPSLSVRIFFGMPVLVEYSHDFIRRFLC